MKGLLLKEWYMLIKNFKSMLLIILVFAAFGLFYNLDMITLIPVFIASIPISTTALDERSGWSSYVNALPVTCRNIVDSKYIFGLLLVIGTSLFYAFIAAAKNGIPYAVQQAAFQSTLGIVYMSMMMPAVFYFGTEKARYINMVVIAGSAMLAVILTIRITNAYPGAEVYFVLPALAFALILLVISELVSVFIYKRKEF